MPRATLGLGKFTFHMYLFCLAHVKLTLHFYLYLYLVPFRVYYWRRILSVLVMNNQKLMVLQLIVKERND